MNAAEQINRILDECGAVLVRQNKHKVYRLPNNQTFVLANTASDHRAAANSLSDLRRILGITKQEQSVSTATVTPEVPLPVPVEAPATPAPVSVASDATPPEAAPPAAPAEPKPETLADRIVTAIAQAEQEQLLLAAQLAERRVHLLTALQGFADDPTVEATLRKLVGAPKPGPVVKAATVAPQARAVSSVYPVIVTRDRVLEMAQKLGTDDRAFTTVQLTDAIIGDQRVESRDRNRIHASVSHAAGVLAERGLIQLHEKGYGKRPSIWRMPGAPTKKPPKVGFKAEGGGDVVPNSTIYEPRKVNGVKTLRTIRTQ
jgi:hypothetical protein